MSFDKPQVLISFLAFIPLIFLGVYHYHTRYPFLSFFISPIPSSERDALLGELRLRYFFSCGFFGLFLACIIIALAGPRWGRRIVVEYHRGVDVVFALDLSRSMEVRDVPALPEEPFLDKSWEEEGSSRLERATRIALDMAEASGGIRFGAAIGKGRGILGVPLTYDMETILSFLRGLSSSAITGWGTNLETLITAASEAFQDALPTRRMIILFSDGESWSGSLSAALDQLLDAEITLITVGLGTETGSRVPQEPLFIEKDSSLGTAVPPISYRRGDVLRSIAERTGGVYVDGNRSDAAALLGEQLQSFSPEFRAKGYHVETRAQWRLFIIIALLSLGGARLAEKRLRRHV